MLSDAQEKNYKFIIYVSLVLMFLTSVVDSSGILNLLAFGFCCFAIVCMTHSCSSAFIFMAALMPNFSILTGSFSVITVNRLIFMMDLIVLFYTARYMSRIVHENKMYLLFVIWFLFNVFEVVVIGHSSVVQALPLSVYMLTGLSFLCLNILDEKNSEKLVIAYTAGMSFMIIIACLELLLGKTFFYSLWTGAERYRFGILRPGSTVADPNNLCFFLVPFLFLVNTTRFKALFSDIFRRIILILGVIVIFCTSSRTGMVAAIVGLFFLIFARKKSYFLVTIPFIGLAANGVLILLERLIAMYGSSTSFRHYMVEKGLLVWQSHKLFGIGNVNFSAALQAVDTQRIITDSANTMNTFVYTLVCFGLVGLILYILWWFFLVKRDVVCWIRKDKIEIDTVLRLSAVVSLLILVYTLDTYYMILMWLLPALYHEGKRSEQRS